MLLYLAKVQPNPPKFLPPSTLLALKRLQKAQFLEVQQLD